MSDIISLSRPLDRRQLKNREAMRGALLRLTADKQYEAISVSEIAQAAGIGQATFYRHYSDKDQLLADIAHAFTSEMLSKLTPLVAATDSNSASLALCEFVEERHGICAVLLTGGARNAVRDQILQLAVKEVELSGLSETTWLPGDLGPLYMVTSILTILGWWLQQERRISPQQMSEVIDRLVMKAALDTEGHTHVSER